MYRKTMETMTQETERGEVKKVYFHVSLGGAYADMEATTNDPDLLYYLEGLYNSLTYMMDAKEAELKGGLE